MNSKALKTFISVITILVLLFSIDSIYYKTYVAINFDNTYSTRFLHVKNSEKILLTDELGKQYNIDKNCLQYDKIIKVFNNKRLKIVNKKPFLYDKEKCKITFELANATYTVIAAPTLENKKMSENVTFIVADNSRETSYKYIILKISKKDFFNLFPDWKLEG